MRATSVLGLKRLSPRKLKSKPKQPTTLQNPFQTVAKSFKPARGASEAASGRSSHSFSAAPREVCLQRCDIVVIAGILGGASTGQLELLGSMGQLECSIGVGCVRK